MEKTYIVCVYVFINDSNLTIGWQGFFPNFVIKTSTFSGSAAIQLKMLNFVKIICLKFKEITREGKIQILVKTLEIIFAWCQ
jgi:hypothetical protein